MKDLAPLQWPPDMGELLRKKGFLLGIPFVGPQEKIYRHICEQLLRRDTTYLDLWSPDAESRSLGADCARVIAKDMNWPNDYFIPEDPFAILCWDKTACAVDTLLVSGLLLQFEKMAGISKQTNRWWEECGTKTFGEVIQALLETRKTSRSG